MNLDKIIEVIEKQANVDSSILKEAQELHEKFPYTSIFPMIILKGLKTNKSVHFEQDLKRFAIQVNDRAVLERYLESKVTIPAEVEKKETTEKIEDTKAPKELIIEKVDILENEEKASVTEESAEPNENLTTKKETELKPSTSEQIIETVEKKQEEKKEPESIGSKEEQKSEQEELASEISDQTRSTIKQAEKSQELSPETLRIIAEIQKKYGEEPSFTEKEPEKTLPEDIKEQVEDSSITYVKDESEEKETSTETDKQIDEKPADEVKEIIQEPKEEEKEEEIVEEISDFKLKREKKKKEKKKSKKKKKKRDKAERDELKIESVLKTQQSDSPFKFKQFRGEDEEYYHLEIDFTDLEPLTTVEDPEEISLEEEKTLETPNLSEKPEIQKTKQAKSPQKSIAKSKKNDPQEDEVDPSILVDEESSFQEPVKIEVNEKTEMTFLDWLKANKANTKKAVQRSSEKESRAKSKQKSNSENELIDRFIEDEPSISRSKKEFFSPTKNAKKSLQDDMEIVSETLADLHVYQGAYAKARKLYEKLILKFPEKKSLFAKKLEEISELEKKN